MLSLSKIVALLRLSPELLSMGTDASAFYKKHRATLDRLSDILGDKAPEVTRDQAAKEVAATIRQHVPPADVAAMNRATSNVDNN